MEEEYSDEDSLDENGEKESHFVKYVMQATRSVDNILALDRIRQEVALRDAFVRNPSENDSKGADVMSIITRRNKGKASSSSSAYKVSINGTAQVVWILRDQFDSRPESTAFIWAVLT